MFERFTDRSRHAIVLAQEEARLLRHNYIGTEHLLLGLLADPEGNAARALGSLNVTLDAAREQVREIIGEGRLPQQGHIPFTPRAKKVLELSLREALTLGSQSIGTEHLLLGLVAEGEGVGARIIGRLGASLKTVRERAIELTGNEPGPALTAVLTEPGVPGRRTTHIRVEGLGVIQQTLTAIDRRLARIEQHLGITADEAESPAAEAEPESASDRETAGERSGAPGESSGDEPTASA
jgi:ATP-dependent Clp protease ATP-binding subunit ClpA